ncbi:MAG TPA: rhomboid family intramembrane serine protease [Methylomirabilota bacterium]|nr:rhomboid family intramembrane serine protease [Methylomirabilota bacterium]
MFIPLKDLNPRRTFPLITILLIAANVLVFAYQVSMPPRAERAFVLAYADVPSRLPAWLSGSAPAAAALTPLFTSMFLHAGIVHLLGNMLFLWIFGDNVEDFFGHFGYLVFYFGCGIVASLAHDLSDLSSKVPALGASGAISGVMGAYLVLYPRARVLTLVFIFLVPIPAVVLLGWWFLLQFLGGLNTAGANGAHAAGGVAWWAHVGGFVMGVLVALAFGEKRSRAAYA